MANRLAAFLFISFLAATLALAQATYETLYNFSGQGADGGYPSSSLVQDSAGNLYGTAGAGGIYNRGVVFKLDKAGRETVLYSFSGSEGSTPRSALVRDAAGNLYGTTYYGGDLTCGNGGGCGTVFKLDTSNNLSVLYRFRGYPTDGSNPWAGVVRDSAGNLYGATYSGGTFAAGTVFMVDSAGNETVLHNFTLGSDGGYPYAVVFRDRAGNLYGTASSGGSSSGPCAGGGCGVVFKLDPTGRETVLHTFTGGTDGATPYGGLIQDSLGNFYGTTGFGGSTTACRPNGCGTVFKLDAASHITILHRFNGTDGRKPYAGVIHDKLRRLYGTTFGGGTHRSGVIFKLDVGGTETVLHSFTGAGGANPEAGLARDLGGHLYGTTAAGGGSFGGLVFKLTP